MGLERRIEVTKAFISVEIQQTHRTLVLHPAVHQFSIHGAVANWCRQFGLTEEEKGRINLSVDIFDNCTT